MKKTLALTIFLGSFLSFALEPMIGRTLLPSFGGTPSVWVTCLAAFQVLMVGGYWYAGRVSGRVSFKVHLGLLSVAVVWCMVAGLFKNEILSRVSGLTGIPAADVFIGVLAFCGLGFVLLSANSSVVQVLSGGEYRLYAISNVGSLAGLMSYPLLVEPNCAVSRQWILLGCGIVAYVALLGVCGRGRGLQAASGSAARADAVPLSRTILWLLLPAISCALLNAVTAYLTLDVSPMPLLWAILLGLFLVSYVIGFSGWGRPGLFAVLALAAVLAAAHSDRPCATGGDGFSRQLASGAALVLFGSTFLHAVLYRLRPDKGALPRFYLCNVMGGAVGGVLTAICAPLVFSTTLEYPIMITVVAVALGAYAFASAAKWHSPRALVLGGAAICAIVLVLVRHSGEDMRGRVCIYNARDFFGTVVVTEAKAKMASGAEGVIHEFVHGNTVHGIQARIPGRERKTTCYYTSAGCGYAILGHPKYRSGEPMRVNLVGLGVGVLFGYGRENDYYRAYEISKTAMDVATNTNLFSFVADCPARKELVLGDARKGLEAELAAGVEPYDVIVVDAFTGDNIPYHLSSKEAFELYFKLLKPDGILCVNISNWHLALEPYVKRIGLDFNCPLLGLYAEENVGQLGFAATVAIFCRDPKGMSAPPISRGEAQLVNFNMLKAMKDAPTDEKGSFLPLLRIFLPSGPN